MKLYYSPGACSLASHIVLAETKQKAELVKVDVKAKKTEQGDDYNTVNPKGYVPALGMDDGQVLTEGAAILQYLADKSPESKLAPAAGTLERYRLNEWLTYLASEVHQAFGPFFNPNLGEEGRAAATAKLYKRLAIADTQLGKTPYLLGDTVSVADFYLFVVASWSGFLKIDIAQFKNLGEFQKRIFARPAVQEAMTAEGLLNK